MKKVILQTDKCCFFCGKRTGLHRHEVFYGTSNRRKSISLGLQVWLCAEHHNLSSQGVHLNHERDLLLKKYAQRVFEEANSHEEFMNTFHKNYLGGEE